VGSDVLGSRKIGMSHDFANQQRALITGAVNWQRFWRLLKLELM